MNRMQSTHFKAKQPLPFLIAGAALALLSACSMTGIKIELKPDGSGKAAFMQMNQTVVPPRTTAGFSGVRATGGMNFELRQQEFTFDEINRARLGGITVSSHMRGSLRKTILTIPLDPALPWCGVLNVSHANARKKAKNMRIMQRKMDKEQQKATNPMMGAVMKQLAKMMDVVTVEVELPEKVQSIKLLEPAGKDISWLQKNEKSPMGGSGKKKKNAKLQIPIETILKKEHTRIVVEIRSGPDQEQPKPKTENGKGKAKPTDT